MRSVSQCLRRLVGRRGPAGLGLATLLLASTVAAQPADPGVEKPSPAPDPVVTGGPAADGRYQHRHGKSPELSLVALRNDGGQPPSRQAEHGPASGQDGDVCDAESKIGPRHSEPTVDESAVHGLRSEPLRGKGETVAAELRKAKKMTRRVDVDPTAQSRATRRGGHLALLGATGDRAVEDALADVIGAGRLGDDDGVRALLEATMARRTSQRRGVTTRGRSTGEAVGIRDMTTSGSGSVGLGHKLERRARLAPGDAPDVDGTLDRASTSRVVRRGVRVAQDCYERGLKRNPTLAGEISIALTIDEQGRVSEAVVAGDSMGSAPVASCVAARARRWRFPRPAGGPVDVTVPFVFVRTRGLPPANPGLQAGVVQASFGRGQAPSKDTLAFRPGLTPTL